MHWKLKCLAFRIFEHIPFGSALYSASQRVLSKRYFQILTPDVLAAYNYHVENFRTRKEGATALEFGAGRNLLTSLLLSNAGASRVYA